MRKKLSLLVLLVLIPTLAYAWGVVIVGGGVSSAVYECYVETYMSAWDGDYDGDTDKACFTNGGAQKDENANTHVTYHTDYGEASVGADFPDRDDYVEWVNSGDDGFDDNEGTLYIRIYLHTPDEGTNACFEMVNVGNEATDLMSLGWTATEDVVAYRDGGGESDALADPSVAISEDTWTTIGLSWSVGRGTQDWSITDDAGANWYGDGVDSIADMANAPDAIRMGNLFEGSGHAAYYIDRWIIMAGYQTACPW